MTLIERALLRLYAGLLRLYPPRFRREFAAEMQTVFGDALGSAWQQGLQAVLRLLAREAAQLPPALAREHWQALGEKETGMSETIPSIRAADSAGPDFSEPPVRRRNELLAGVAPFLMILLFDLIPQLLAASSLVSQDRAAMQTIYTITGVSAAAGLLAVFGLAWVRRWPVWSTTWYALFVLVSLALAGELAVAIFGKRASTLFDQGLTMYLLFPLALAFLLYWVTRRSPLRSLLAALPVLYLLWQPNMEFVPEGIEFAVKIPSLLLFCLVVIFLLRRGNWRPGLLLVLAVNLAVGALFAWAGIYHGGSLPFLAGAPSLVEVLRSLVPQYLATGAILLGPLFALRIRQAGWAGGPAARAGYHLALAGLLLVILANLGALMEGTTADSSGLTDAINNLAPWAILLGLLAYLAGLFIVYRDLPQERSAAGRVRAALLALLPLVLPITFMLPFITSTRPVSGLYGTPLLWELPQGLSLGLGLAWLALSVWVVLWERRPARPAASFPAAIEKGI